MSQKIAIIEDDLPISTMYKLKFESEGYVVKTAPNGIDGLELIEEFNPDVVLLDIMMPLMDGIEMLTKLRQSTYGKKTKVLLFTNVGGEDINSKIKNLDVSDVVLKAELTPGQVVEKIQAVLSK